ncbi:MAG: sulfhydrogenase subunit delta [Hydrogenophilaceae bacterium]|nr:sulfhydrogenase subunit delta [Hydrogenophilaceae bacterium]
MSANIPVKPKVAIHKFSSCDGCQLALLDMGPELLSLAEQVDFVHFAEAGPCDPDTQVDLAFVEGSIATQEDLDRIQRIRAQSKVLVAIGACATAGGLQALRNSADGTQWVAEIYSQPEHIDSLPQSTPLSAHVKVDFELWGCPVNSLQVAGFINHFLLGVLPRNNADKVCTECKRRGLPCVLVSRGIPCMGPVTRAGCGALCPGLGRDCYGCYGPAENPNTDALAAQFRRLGLTPQDIARRFENVNNFSPAFLDAAQKLRKSHHG